MLIDAMKCQQNSLHWPYIAPCVLDENKTVAVVCESIVIEERLDAYKFVLKSLFEMAPKRPKSQVHVLALDCFVTPSLLEMLGIETTCKLMWDHYHILESIWPKKLGVYYFTELRTLLSRLLNAHSGALFKKLLPFFQFWQVDQILSATCKLGQMIGNIMPNICLTPTQEALGAEDCHPPSKITLPT